ncbi:MAG: glycosyltransferase family 87 protein [Saprospiraceae bacterium]
MTQVYYLYSPLFAILLVPFTFFDWSIARIIWVFINIIFTVRLWQLLEELVTGSFSLSRYYKRIWTIAVAVLSFGFLNHNLNLGQVTILILWLTMEGLYHIMKKNELKGAALLALGINIKIIPLIALGYLFLKGKFKAIIYTLAFVGLSLLLPAFIIGWEYNNELLGKWKEAINPAKEKFAFENNDGCNSLNALLPAFLYDQFEEPSNIEAEPDWTFKRKIADLPAPLLTITLQISRILVLLFVPFSVFFYYKNRQHSYLYYHWEIAYLLLVTLLIFPHQMKYSMLYFIPAGAYVLFYYIFMIQEKLPFNRLQAIIGGISGIFLLILAIMGRDIIGHYLVNILDFYHFMGFSNLFFLLVLAYCNPPQLIKLAHQKQGLV